MIEVKNVEHLFLEVERVNQNLRIISVINKIYIIVLLSSIITIYILEIVSSNPFNILLLQLSLSLIMALVYFYLLDVRKINVSEKNYKRNNILSYFYIGFFLNLAALLPVINQNFYHPIIIYTFILLTCCQFLVLKSKELLPLLSISSFILFIGLRIQNVDESIYYLQGIYLFALVTVAYFGLRSKYDAFFSAQKLRMEMGKEVKHYRELTEFLKEANRQLQQEASLDPLTNLYNRRAYNDYIFDLQKRLLESAHIISVIMVDVDCFKLYNDTYGHSEGDKVLSEIGSLLQRVSVEYSCFAARFGGEEFVLILSNEPDEVVQKICYQIQQRVCDLNIEHESSTIDSIVTVSIGACTKSITDVKGIYECISEADAALYFVKENGRNSFEYRHRIHA